MPYIFPKRFLRTRDLITPEGFNSDIHPAYDTLSGRLDRTNFQNHMSGFIRPHPNVTKDDDIAPSVSEGAYYNIHTNQIESRYRFYTSYIADADYTSQPRRHPPNFVDLDGATMRYTHPGTFGSGAADHQPSVIPNNGAWTAVRNEDLTGPQQLTFTTGQSKIWISAYLQYIWQGFYEYKSPYITGARTFSGVEDLGVPGHGERWVQYGGEGEGGEVNWNLANDEAAVLNFLGPATIHEHLSDPNTENRTENVVESSAEYAYPLNERGIYEERVSPSLCGFHHISRGWYPSLVQFAIRVDGKILEETITGKKFSFEESPHGLTVTDSVRLKEDEEDDESEEARLRAFLPFFTTHDTLFGQRSATVSSAYGDSDDCRPGQKVKSSRAVSCGPEVMPVRIGAVIEVQPGTHTIEIVARRLQRKKGKFIVGDFVGVFSRRLLAFDLPINSRRNDMSQSSLAQQAFYGGEGILPDVPSFKTEDKINETNVVSARTALANTINNLNETNIDTNVLDHELLPSKVTFQRSVSITPGLRVQAYTGLYNAASENNAFSSGVFAGFLNEGIDRELSDMNDGWYKDIDSPGRWLTSDRAGWYPIQNNPGSVTSSADNGEILKIKPDDTDSSGEAKLLRPGEIIIAMMDVEVRRIEPLYSPEADKIIGSLDMMTDGKAIGKMWRNFGNWLMTERYLDLFALFAIGYKLDGSYVIGSKAVPGLLNSYNWCNRSIFFNSGPKSVYPFRVMEGTGPTAVAPWDVNPGWGNFPPTEREALFDNDYERAPKLRSRGGNLVASNMGITIPIMQVIENNTSTDQIIDEFGGYVSTMVPDDWTMGHSPDSERRIESDDGSDSHTLPSHWISPVGGRKILAGCQVHFGNSRLTIIKTWK